MIKAKALLILKTFEEREKLHGGKERCKELYEETMSWSPGLRKTK